ncbi:uncharacterized protein MONBRDRAFT_24250 [Monosiga brevicollis MX1]|uniref:DDE-1 domain-containing protein n=1 Tax=Monosiga brevicollis TaxID=81824 RepID=A9UVU9_MONBE|nr:uncharacterized protein MONBRDRAFT_24250 [Monosiga brevicollis MX1]EDQ90653.1 predicted protein [Monosiga brevicollis MX1]|eukprot:XP_001744704.1 hypothetical protein [Monosiga brevicollis MX1]
MGVAAPVPRTPCLNGCDLLTTAANAPASVRRLVNASRRAILIAAKEHANRLVSEGFPEYAEFRASHNWLRTVKEKMGLQSVSVHDEGGSVDETAAATAMEAFHAELGAHGVDDPDCIINCDETVLCWKQIPSYRYTMPDSISASSATKHLKDQNRATLILATTLSGLKVPLTLIGKPQHPPCFDYDPPNNGDTRTYFSQNRAWTDRATMLRWLKEVLIPWKRSIVGTKKIVLIWDNAHSIDSAMLDGVCGPDELAIVCLPANLTARHQPLDAGIIAAFKTRYKGELLRRYAELAASAESFQSCRQREAELQRDCGMEMQLSGIKFGRMPSLSDALDLSLATWETLSTDTIINCWLKAACVPLAISTQVLRRTEQGRNYLMELQSDPASKLAADCGYDDALDVASIVDRMALVSLSLLRCDGSEFNDLQLPPTVQAEADSESAARYQIALEDTEEAAVAMTQLALADNEVDAAREAEAEVKMEATRVKRASELLTSIETLTDRLDSQLQQLARVAPQKLPAGYDDWHRFHRSVQSPKDPFKASKHTSKTTFVVQAHGRRSNVCVCVCVCVN